MKRTAFFITILLLLAVISGYLLSKASFVGKAGIDLFYEEYSFLKVWWQGGLLVFLCWILLFSGQATVQKRAERNTANAVHVFFVVLALAGLYFTYNDFRHTLSHRLLGERFHLGAYLFWIGWMLISLFFLSAKREYEGITAIE